VNKILKDIIVKAKTLSGFDAPYVPGWDCHGLPIEHQVEKKHGKNIPPREVPRTVPRLRRRADRAAESRLHPPRRARRLGSSRTAPWTFQFEADIIRVAGADPAGGYLYQGAKPVHWCVDCGSALAEAEVEYEDKTSPAIDVASVADQGDLAKALRHSRMSTNRPTRHLDHHAVDAARQPGGRRASRMDLRAGALRRAC
jgi:isoleucyl-tRNA synthetase